MKRVSTYILRLSLLAIAVIVLVLCIFAIPPMWTHIPEEYPNITYAFYAILSLLYVAAIPLFFALYQAVKMLGYIDKNKAFSKLSANALKRISYCGAIITGVFVAMSPFLYVWAQEDDAPGLILFGMLFAGASLTVAVFAALMNRLLTQAIELKSENDLTV